MKRPTLEKLLVGAFWLALLLAPEGDYYLDAWDFVSVFSLISVFQDLPILAVAIALIVFAIRPQDSALKWYAYPALKWLIAAAIIECLLQVLSTRQFTVPDPYQGAYDKFEIIGFSLVILSILTVAVTTAIAFVLVPGLALVRGISRMIKRDAKGALRYFAVPLVGLACFFVGSKIADALAIQRFGPGIQSAIQDVREGAILFESTGLTVSKKPPYVASYQLAAGEGHETDIVYDAADAQTADETFRIGMFLSEGKCETRIRRIGSHYYFANENCP